MRVALWSGKAGVHSALGGKRIVRHRGTASGTGREGSGTCSLPAAEVQLLPDARCIAWLPCSLIVARRLHSFVWLGSRIRLLLGSIRREGRMSGKSL